MKYVIIFMTMFLTTLTVNADTNCSDERVTDQAEEQLEINTAVPSHLKGAKIIVRLADGRESEVSAEKFKVVPRVQQFLVTKVKTATVRSCTTTENRKNRIALLAGEGPTGTLAANRDEAPNKATVSSERGRIGGLQYQRMLNDRVSAGIQGSASSLELKSPAVLGTLGYDF